MVLNRFSIIFVFKSFRRAFQLNEMKSGSLLENFFSVSKRAYMCSTVEVREIERMPIRILTNGKYICVCTNQFETKKRVPIVFKYINL